MAGEAEAGAGGAANTAEPLSFFDWFEDRHHRWPVVGEKLPSRVEDHHEGWSGYLLAALVEYLTREPLPADGQASRMWGHELTARAKQIVRPTP